MTQRSTQVIGWCFTLANFTDDEVADINRVLSSENIKYAIYQREIGGNTELPHLQGYVEFVKKQRFATVKRLLNNERLHLEPRRGTRTQARDYCKKDDTRTEGTDPNEFGTWRSEATKSGKLAEILLEAKRGATLQSLSDICPSTYVRNYRGVAHYRLLHSTSRGTQDVRGLWIYGKPGVGKSHKVRTDNPGHYLKSQDKWWDGYNGEDVVIIEDLDRMGVGLSHYLKIWADKWPFQCEVKGGHCKPNFTKLIVTSNYTISDLFLGEKQDRELVCALQRRFKTLRAENHTDPIDPTQTQFVEDNDMIQFSDNLETQINQF